MTRPIRPTLWQRFLVLVGVRREASVRRRVRAECDTLERWSRRQPDGNRPG